MNALQQRFNAHWEARRFGTSVQPVLLALSGGVDSMALARLLLDAGVGLACAHCNFGLRGEASDGDAAFVAEWCAANGVTLHVKEFDTAAVAEGRRQSIQLAARELRYEWFDTLRKEHGYA